MKLKNFSILIFTILSMLTYLVLFFLHNENFNTNLKHGKKYLSNFLISNDLSKKVIFDVNTLKTTYIENNCECKNSAKIAIIDFKNFTSIYLKNESKAMKHLFDLSKNEMKNTIFTCGLYNSLRRGKAQKVISYSLYNKNTFYYDKLRDISKQLKTLYPGWIMRVYYDNSIDKSIICEIECQKDDNGVLLDNADFCDINNIKLQLNSLNNTNSLDASYIHAMIWRWFPLGDSFVDVFSSRDTDSYLLQREVDSVNVWLKSDKLGHIMRGEEF